MSSTYKMQAETEAAAAVLAAELNHHAGLQASWNTKDTRDWLAKVRITGAGNICVYSDAKGKISLKFHELTRKDLTFTIEETFQNARCAPFVPLAAAKLPLTAHPDGSFRDDRTGFGVVITDSAGNRVHEACGGVPNNPNRQIIGEIEAAQYTLRWAKQNGIKEITICPDYKGIIHWADGSWQANDPAAQAYAAEFRASGIKVSFQKAAGHSTDRLNERADILAEQGRCLPMHNIRIEDAAGVTMMNFSPSPLRASSREQAEAALREGNASVPLKYLEEHGNTPADLKAFLQIAHDRSDRLAVETLTHAAQPQQLGLALRAAANFGTPDTFRIAVHLVQATQVQTEAALELARMNPEPKSRAQRNPNTHWAELKQDIGLYFEERAARETPSR